MQYSYRQKGNALFLILIAVALFAALSYAITQSGRGSGDTKKETDAIVAAQLMQIGSDLKVAAQRMILTGTPAAAVRMNTGASGSGAEPCVVTDGTCLFTPEGGNAVVPHIPTSAFVGYDAATSVIYIEIDQLAPDNPNPFAIDGIGTSAPDAVIFFVGLTEGVCRAMNKGLGISGIPAQDNHWSDTLPVVTLTATTGHPAGCLDATVIDPAAGYVGYHVVIEN